MSSSILPARDFCGLDFHSIRPEMRSRVAPGSENDQGTDEQLGESVIQSGARYEALEGKWPLRKPL
ncbi:MAG: hypothetical protein JO251_01650 [Verrucomicrobia bacterium]|nr:hypothetical protein [Verrucomicrobiota bacterium]